MEIQLEKTKESETDSRYPHNVYTINISGHRMLTVETDIADTAAKWLKEVIKTGGNNKYGSLLVGVTFDELKNYCGTEDTVLLLCVGSHCLLYHLPQQRYCEPPPPKALHTFFSDHRVLAAGIDIAGISKRLSKDYGVKVENPVDLNVLATKALKRDDLDLPNYDLDRLVTTVLGKQVYVDRPEKPVRWYGKKYYLFWKELGQKKVKYAVTDSYLCYLIGSELLELMEGSYPHYFPVPEGMKKKSKKKY